MQIQIADARQEYKYTPCYCEENIYHLCKLDPDLTPIFISNCNKTVPFFNQKSLPTVVWDYHVIGIKQNLVFDFDSALGFPIDWNIYKEQSLGTRKLPLEFERFYRVIPNNVFLKVFSSDRSHMKNKDGIYSSTPPEWPCIINEIGANTLDLFIDMASEFVGQVMKEDLFSEFMDQR